MYRVEDKYLCSEKDLFLLQSKLNIILRSDGNQINDHGYKITSVYFDTYDDRCLRESEEGVRSRKKYRIRIYNDSFQTIKLEVKFKQDNRVRKRSCSISVEQMRRLLEGKAIEDSFDDMENPVFMFNMAMKTEKLTPKVIVEYDRKAYVFPAGNVRITLDRNIRMSGDVEGFLQGNLCRYRELPAHNCVLEVKYDEFLPGFIARVLESGNMNQIAYSKYKLCRNLQEETKCR